MDRQLDGDIEVLRKRMGEWKAKKGKMEENTSKTIKEPVMDEIYRKGGKTPNPEKTLGSNIQISQI